MEFFLRHLENITKNNILNEVILEVRKTTDKLLKQTRKCLLYKIILRAGFNHATVRFWPAGRMFDTPDIGRH